MGLPEDIHEIVLARLAREIKPEQEVLLQQWLKESEQNRREYREFCALWYSARWGNQRDNVNRSVGWERIVQVHRKKNRRRLFTRIPVAASVILAIGIFGMYWSQENGVSEVKYEPIVNQSEVTLILSSGDEVCVKDMQNNEILEDGVVIRSDSSCLEYRKSEAETSGVMAYNELVVPKCGEYRLRLADGSLVIMNSESRLRFPVEFIGDEREVYLEGEACFEVMKDTEKPFIVHTTKADVRVLGTVFNVSAYSGEINTEVTLVDGKVQVRAGSVEKLLIPDQQFVLNNSTSEIVVREVNAQNYITWTNGLFRFDAMPLGQLMIRLGRWYDITYEFKDASLQNVRFTGGFRKYDDIRHIVGMIGEITHVTFKVDGNKVIIDKK